MSIQGLPENEAKEVFDSWDISAQANANKITIRSSSSNFGNEFFFINNDKYLGNIIVDIPEISDKVIGMLDSIHFVLPELDNFPDVDLNFNPNFQIAGDSIAFDFEEFQNNTEYLEKWQEEHKEEMERIKKELKESRSELAQRQKEMKIEIREAQREELEKARIHAREVQREAMQEARIHAREAQQQVREEMQRERQRAIEEGAREREYQVQRILRDRQKVKIKKTLRIKVPKNAKLEMDVDYCKISTVK
jgi:Skp family chaperone for outer membrane proteins